VFNGDTAYITQPKQQKSKKVLLLLQHVAIMSTCSYVIAPVSIFVQVLLKQAKQTRSRCVEVIENAESEHSVDVEEEDEDGTKWNDSTVEGTENVEASATVEDDIAEWDMSTPDDTERKIQLIDNTITVKMKSK